jgi:hypothetical protein
VSAIFISHSKQDLTIALQVLDRLREQGYQALFLDSDPESGIKAGRDWEWDLYRNLKLAAAVVVLCSPDSMASRWCFAEITQAKALGKALFPVVIRPCEVAGSLSDRQVVDMTSRGEEEGFQRLFDGLRAAGLDPVDSFGWDHRRPPFPGLLYFDREDAGIYFGREAEVRVGTETLTRMQRQGEPRLLVVVGSSGSGKSSLVRAGVLPRLDKDRWRWVVIDPIRPGTEPVSELARSLSLAFPDGPDRPAWRDVRDRLGDEARTASPDAGANHTLVTSVLNEYGDDLTMALGRRAASVLVVVDQAEELLQGVAPEESATFLTVLRRATARPGGRVFGLLTLRSDFLGSFQGHPALMGVAFADIVLGPLPVESFPQVIEGPAARAEIALGPGLVPSLIADARTDDALPLLAFTLREMYERCRDQATFTLEVYRDDLGRINGAVARVVERIKSEGEWRPETSHALRRAFLKLARVNDEGQFTRQRARWADLPDHAASVLEAFVKARLLTSNGDTVEVAHESIFRVWPELAGWLDEGRELMLWKKSIHDDVRDWASHGRSPDWVLGGARVAEARRWLARHGDDFQDLEAEFLRSSLAEDDRRAAAERRSKRRLRAFAVGASILAAAAIGLGVAATYSRWETRRELAMMLQKSGQQECEDRRLGPGLVLFVRSLSILPSFSPDLESETRRQIASWGGSLPRLLRGIDPPRPILSVDVSPDGTRLVTIDDAEGLQSWDLRDGRSIAGPFSIGQDGPDSVSYDPRGRVVMTRGPDSVRLWSAADLTPVSAPIAIPTAELVSLSADNRRVLTASGEENFVAVWDVETGKRLATWPHSSLVQVIAFSPDGGPGR